MGRRLAFDPAKGRLWAVCRKCERWNLSPLEERWEAIEECERLFRATRLRVSTEHVGLARISEGTTLVRIGDPQRPEMAAWRYGDQFHRRRRRYIALTAGAVVAGGGFLIAGPVMGLLGGASINLINLVNLPNLILSQRTVVRVPLNGQVLRLIRMMVRKAELRPDGERGWELLVPYKESLRTQVSFRLTKAESHVVLSGADALAAARQLLPRLNHAGGGAKTVAEAVSILELAKGSASLFGHAANAKRRVDWEHRGVLTLFRKKKESGGGPIALLPVEIRLALEMSLHEEDERRALEGELLALEQRWREAEEVAGIADDLTLPTGIGAMLGKLRGSKDDLDEGR